MASLPTVGGSTGTWGTELNDYLRSLTVSVQDFGATGDGSTDDTSAIQDAIDAACAGETTGSILFFPAGKYVISSTLVIPDFAGGGVVMGSGSYLDNPYDAGSTRTGSQTVIYWNGTAGGTMLEGQGVQGWTFENLTLVGRRPAAGGNRAGIGYLQKYVASGGGLVGGFEMSSFYDIAVAVQMGEVSGDDSCADVGFVTCVWQGCDTAVLIKNTQGVNYRFESPSLVSTVQFIHAQSGGSILVNMLNTASCGGTGSTDWVFLLEDLDDNRGFVLINGWRAEQNTKQLIKAASMGHVVVNGFEECQADQNLTMFDIRGPRLTVRDSKIITNDGTEPTFHLDSGGGGQKAHLVCDNIHFKTATWTWNNWIETSTNEVVLQIMNSQYGTAADTQLPDVNSHLQHGPVNYYGQTTTATDRWLSLNGSTSANFNNMCLIPADSTWLIDAYIVGQEVGGGGDVATFQRRATVKNTAGTMSIVGSVQTVGTDQNTDGWASTIQVDSGLDCVAIDVTGKTSTTINWKVRIVGTRADAIV